MDHVTSGDAWLTWMRRARARTRRDATIDLDELSLLDQLTVGVLSHHAAACANLRLVRCSRTMNSSRLPAISKSELVMSPLGFENETTRSLMSCGNSSRQTVGWMNLDPGSQTPPAPSLVSSFPR